MLKLDFEKWLMGTPRPLHMRPQDRHRAVYKVLRDALGPFRDRRSPKFMELILAAVPSPLTAVDPLDEWLPQASKALGRGRLRDGVVMGLGRGRRETPGGGARGRALDRGCGAAAFRRGLGLPLRRPFYWWLLVVVAVTHRGPPGMRRLWGPHGSG